MTFVLSQQEFERGEISEDKLDAIASDIEKRGFAVVAPIIPPEVCDLLAQSVLDDAERVRAAGQVTPHEERTARGHLQLGLRRYAPYVRPELLASPLIESVVAATLGAGAWLGFYSGNVNLPGSAHQPVHYDRPFSWLSRAEAEQDGQRWPPPTTTLSCSVALTEINEGNGATEIYPGSHLETAVTAWPLGERVSKHPDMLEKWGPPARMSIPAGGICFRDPRMWHRGVPNTSSQVRPMIALTYHAERCRHWRGRLVRDLSPQDAERCLADPSLRVMDDGELSDGRLVFEASAREALTANASRHGVNRNYRFVTEPMRVNHFLDAHLVGGARVVTDGVIAPVV